MASNFLQAALDILGRPGNAVRGALIDGPQGAMTGLTGGRQYDPTELPGINQLPDEGVNLGPLHLTPRTVAGFAGSTLLDPLTYVGGGLGRLGELGGRGAGVADDLLMSGAKLPGGSLGRELSGAYQAGVTIPSGNSIMASLGKAGLDPQSSPVEDLVNHLNANHGLNLEIKADSPAAAESAVADQTGSEAGDGRLRPNIPPNAEATPVGDQRYAQARGRLGQTQAQLGELNGRAIPARQWLTETSQDTLDKPAQTWEDVIGVPRGTSPTDPLVAERQANPRTLRESTPDMSQGPGLTSNYRGETVGFSRQEVMSHLGNLEQQIQELTRTLTGDKGSRFGDPLEKRGMENTLSDWQAKRQMAADPSVLQPEINNSRASYERWAADNGKTTRPGLSDKQMNVVRNKTGQQLSRDETFRRAPDSRYYNGGEASLEDEANIPMQERDSRAPHGDPLEEDRAQRDQQEKFGRKGSGTYRASEDLGHSDNERGPGAGGVRGNYESGDVGTGTGMDASGRFQDGAAPVHVTGERVDEPTAGLADAQQEAHPLSALERIRTQALIDEIRQLASRPMHSALPQSPQSFRGHVINNLPPHR